MENQVINADNSSEEEISLIDLFAVVLKYRKLIIIGTLVVTFLAGLFLFLAPNFSSKLGKKKLNISYYIKIDDLPVSIRSHIPYAISALSIYDMSDINVVAQTYKEYNFLDYDFSGTADRFAYNKFVKDLLDKKKIEVKTSPLGDHIEVILLSDFDKIDESRAYVEKLVEGANKKLENLIMTQFTKELENLEASIETLGANLATMSDPSAYQRLVDDKKAIETFMGSYKEFLTLENGSFIVSEAQGRVKKLAIVFFAAFFVTVFISFAMNAVANIKADPEASKKISDAWKAGK